MILNSYILSLEVMGIKNIEKPISLKFYKDTINKDIKTDKYKIHAIYGENGSGKTAVISAVRILQQIIINRHYLSDSLSQRNLVENINKRTKSGYIQIEYYIYLTKRIYQYRIDFEVREDHRFYIVGEELKTKKGGNSRNVYLTVFQTQKGELKQFGNDICLEIFRDKTLNLLEQSSLVSFARLTLEEEIQIPKEYSEPINHVYCLFAVVNQINIYRDGEDDHRYHLSTKLASEEENADYSGGMSSFIYDINKYSVYDLSKKDKLVIKENIEVYRQHVARLFRFIHLFKPDLIDIQVDEKEQKECFQCRLIMKYDGFNIDSEFESRGIKKLIELFDVLDAASSGEIAFIDELDSHINDVYLGKIIEYFTYYGQGQLCFTSHNLSPMKVLKKQKGSISFLSSVNTVHTWANDGNRNPENAYRDGFVEDSPFNIEASDFLGILGGSDE